MGLRALGFLPFKTPEDQIQLRENLKQALTVRGAFGFEPWTCTVLSLAPAKDRSGERGEVKLITLSDSNYVIAIHGDILITADLSADQLRQTFGLVPGRVPNHVIQGQMAQLGDFKIRYGTIMIKEKAKGIIFDIEYLPVQLLSADFTQLFSSVVKMLTDQEVKLYTPPVMPGETYSFTSLGSDYMKVIEEATK